MVSLIKGDVPDIKQEHCDFGKKLGAKINSVYYNIETVKRKIFEAGGFVKYMATTQLSNRDSLMQKHNKGEI